VHDSGRGAHFELRDLPNADPGMSPMEIWCNEAQERYVLGIRAEDLETFTAICERERCPFAVVGETTEEERLCVSDRLLGSVPVDIPIHVLFGKPPKMTRQLTRTVAQVQPLETKDITIDEAVSRVLQLPAVGSKKFLITIGDRTVGGLTTRDPMVGPWQVPVSDVAVTASSFGSKTGEAMAMGERAPVALVNGPASARLAIGEVITNMAAAPIAKLSDIKLSANWMAAVGYGQEDEKLYDTVKAIGEDFCPALGITIPVGKDSLSMRSSWDDGGHTQSVVGPLSLVTTGFAPVTDVVGVLTPQLVTADRPTVLILVDLGGGNARLGASALAQVYNQVGDEVPDIDPAVLKAFFVAMQKLHRQKLILAYHDRSDGGLLATLAEMMFAGRKGMKIDLDMVPGASLLARFFNEELGVVLQVHQVDASAVCRAFGANAHRIGIVTDVPVLVVVDQGIEVYRKPRAQLEQWWADTSYRIQALRGNATAADQEFAAIGDDADPGITPAVHVKASKPKRFVTRPKVAIFREQGVNGQVEMAAAFDRAGFTAVDVPLNDLVHGTASLQDFVGLAACGGFSYGDVLGAGGGWAKSILFHSTLRKQFESFFDRPDTFSLGVCNGCQMLSSLKEIIPGAEIWPTFQRNTSEQFEARLVMVKVAESPSVFFRGMAGSQLPIPVAHGEGYAQFTGANSSRAVLQHGLVVLQYTDNYGKVTEAYPLNPNGSSQGITALTTPDGRATILMPHPERAFLSQQLSWHPAGWAPESPWFQMFLNAREWVYEADKRMNR
jgi:phosphoribosylformylglycinamidine synthase